MRIALVTTEWPGARGQTGGMASHFHRLAQALAARGWSVEVFVVENGEPSEIGYSLHVHQIKRERTPGLSASCRLAIAAHFCVASAHVRQPFDLVVSAPNRGLASELTKRPIAPTVIRLSSDGLTWRAMNRVPDPVLDELEEETVLGATALYAPSKLVCSLVETRLSVRAARLPSFVDLSEFRNAGRSGRPYDIGQGCRQSHAPCNRVKIGYFGGPERTKGFDLLLGAIKRLDIVRPGLSMALCMSRAPPAQFRIRRPLTSLSVGECRSTVFAMMRKCDVVVVPSRLDNCPNVALEAMALGCVVVGIKGSGLEELIRHRYTGFLARNASPASLAVAIRLALEAPRSVMVGRNARRFIRTQFSVQARLPDLIRYFEQVARQGVYSKP